MRACYDRGYVCSENSDTGGQQATGETGRLLRGEEASVCALTKAGGCLVAVQRAHDEGKTWGSQEGCPLQSLEEAQQHGRIKTSCKEVSKEIMAGN